MDEVPIDSSLKKKLCQLVPGSFMMYSPESGKTDAAERLGGRRRPLAREAGQEADAREKSVEEERSPLWGLRKVLEFGSARVSRVAPG